MESYSKEKEANKTRVQLNISSQGDLKFDAQGPLEDWQLTDAIAQARKAASETRRHNEKLEEIKAASLFWSHALAFAFLSFLVFGGSLTLARAISSGVQQTNSIQEIR